MHTKDNCVKAINIKYKNPETHMIQVQLRTFQQQINVTTKLVFNETFNFCGMY